MVVIRVDEISVLDNDEDLQVGGCSVREQSCLVLLDFGIHRICVEVEAYITHLLNASAIPILIVRSRIGPVSNTFNFVLLWVHVFEEAVDEIRCIVGPEEIPILSQRDLQYIGFVVQFFVPFMKRRIVEEGEHLFVFWLLKRVYNTRLVRIVSRVSYLIAFSIILRLFFDGFRLPGNQLPGDPTVFSGRFVQITPIKF